MAPSLKQEVNLSRRACRQEEFRMHNLKANQSICKNHNNFLNNLTGAKITYNNNLIEENSNANKNNNNYDNSNYRKINNNFSQLHNNNNNKLNDSNLILNDSFKCKKIVNCSINRISVVLVLIGILFYSTNLCADARPNGTQVIDGVETTISPNAIPNDEHKIGLDGGDLKPDGKMANLKAAGDENHTTEHRYEVSSIDFERVEAPFIISVWILAASIAKIGFHMTPKLHKFFPESCLLIVIGIIVGIILHFATSVHMSPLTPTTFFFYMLPPIILDAGYFMPNRLFFDNLGTILLMAVVGTIFNTGLIGLCLYGCGLTGIYGADINLPILHIFLFSALISAVDPVAVLAVFEEIHVNEILYIVVFGESLLNDAVTVVLYHMFEAYTEIGIDHVKVVDAVSGVASFFVVALGGTIIGVIWGFATGLVTKYTDHVRVIEPIFIFIMAYLAYLNAEIFHMSGILAITFCGITMKNYVEANISHKSHTTIKYALKMLSSSSETIIFIFLGVATVNNRHVWNTWFVVLTIFFCSVIRSIGVILLTWMANRVRVQQLTNVDKFVISYGGLRGAVAFALVLLIDPKLIPNQPMFVTTTIAVIYFTVFVQGITIGPLVKLLKVKRASKRKPTMNERIHEKVMDHLMAGVEDVIGKTGNYTVRDKFKRFDIRFIRPFLIRDLQSAEPKILETYSKLTMKDAIDIMRRNPSTVGQLTNTESMSALFRNYTGMFGGRLGTSFLGTCPSFSNLENCSRNLDMQELDYNPSKKDLTDAKIHHLLAEELKPYRRHRRLSYSRHAVDDRDLTTQVNYRMQMSTRRMVNDRKHHKRSKRLHKDGSKTNHVSFPEFQQNGSAKQLSNGTKKIHHTRKFKRKHSHSSLNKYRRLELDYINEVLQEGAEDDDDKICPSDDWEGGLTFTAKSTPMHSPPADEEYDSAYDHENSSSLIAHIASLPGFDTSKARLVKHYYMSKSNSEKEIVPTAAELILPWRRDRSYQSIGSNDTNQMHENFKRFSKDSEGEERTATPTATESVLPWKRGDEDGQDGGAIKQNEFPAWASNKEYLAYNSPSATFLGGLNKPKQVRSVIGLFRRESSGSGSVAGGAPTGSDTSIQMSGVQHINHAPPSPQPPSAGPPATIAAIVAATPARPSTISLGVIPNNSIVSNNNNNNSDTNDPLGALSKGHTGPFAVTASHRRNNRRGSLLELSGEPIPEENYTKSLPEREKYGLRRAVGQQPLLKLTTPRSNRHLNPQNVALLSSSSTESDDDYDDEIHDDDDDDDDGGDGLKMKNT